MRIILLSLFPLIAALVISWFLAQEFYKAAIMKGWNSKKYFWLSFFFGIAGYLLVIALPDRGAVQQMSVMVSDDLPEL